MRAYENGISKEQFVSEMEKHAKADAFTKGSYWSEGKGCAIGCGIKSIETVLRKRSMSSYSDHFILENHLGIPMWLAMVEDRLFEGMSVSKSKIWPVQFAKAVNCGSDLNSIKIPFLCVLITHSLQSLNSIRVDNLDDATKNIIGRGKIIAGNLVSKLELYAEGKATSEELSDARRDANAAAANAAAANAAASAANAAASYAAYYAASAASAAASYAAASAASDAAAASANGKCNAYDYYADELLVLISNCK